MRRAAGREDSAQIEGVNSAFTEDNGLSPGRCGSAFAAVAIGVSMATLDTSIINTALPTIAADIGADAATSIWAINSYQLAVVAALLPLAAVGDRIGHRRVFSAGLILFTLTSLACGFAWSLPSLVVARALQGLGSAGIISVNIALIRFIYPVRMLGRGVGLNALVVGLAFTVGPTIASCILSVATWHWLFLVNVPAGLIAFLIASRTLPATATSLHRFDAPAASLCAAFFGLLILAVGSVSQGYSPRISCGEFAGSAVCCLALRYRQRAHPTPILAIDLFKNPLFTLSALTSLFSFTTQGLAFVSLPFLLQSAFAHTQVETGFLMTPWPAIVAVMAPVAGRLSDRFSPGLLGGIGLLALGIGMCALACLPTVPSTLDLEWRLVLCGAGFGFFQSPNLRAMMTSAPPHRSGGASGIVASARLLGQTTGAALVALTFHIWREEGPWIALWLGCAFSFAGSAASFLRLLPGRAPRDEPSVSAMPEASRRLDCDEPR